MSDEELVERARSGDRGAFGELVERHQQAVFRTALVALRSREEAEEVAQDALVSAFQKLERFRGESSFKTWLLTIAWNASMDRRRRAGQWFRRFVSSGEEQLPEPASPAPSHETTLIDRQERLRVRQLLRTLPAKYRDPLMLASTGDHTFEQIAALLRIPVGTAKWRASEGRRILRQKLQGGGRRTAGGRQSEAEATP